ncbi:DEAD DEAH box helicase family protein [Cryptosporidium andersoni]|uniref:DEAD DEAH box helicase family protein n=1 Tax=Cryptosporidium andersoni TaxID=117008 RepID=A0A1J4MU73_9CRYT|nr:DEAD DEAH box helicase family protein [Cryptosporidium andersoni]
MMTNARECLYSTKSGMEEKSDQISETDKITPLPKKVKTGNTDTSEYCSESIYNKTETGIKVLNCRNDVHEGRLEEGIEEIERREESRKNNIMNIKEMDISKNVVNSTKTGNINSDMTSIDTECSIYFREESMKIEYVKYETGKNCVHECVRPCSYVAPTTSKFEVEYDSDGKKIPAKVYPFKLDTFQAVSIECLEMGESILVSAHTSAGKTCVAEYAIAMALRSNQRVVYTSPIKALSNQKYRDLRSTFGDGNVGLLTGDVTVNPLASIMVMTTEILRSMLYRGSELVREIAWVIFDEIHYMRDKERGVVWEESIILLPDTVRLVFLSATIPNHLEFAEWICRTKHQPCHVVYTDYRPVPLQHFVFPAGGTGVYLVMDENKIFREDNYSKALSSLKLTTEERSNRMGEFKKKNTRSQLRMDLESIVNMCQERNYLPIIVFSFSKKDCETNAMYLGSTDLTNSEEKESIDFIFQSALATLAEEDRNIPQVVGILPLLRRGIGIHHGGLLPVVKEIVEILFGESFIKVLFSTETFSMGINMPAKTVIFTSLRKFDGKESRLINSGEFIQMSGRAGRRGLDDRGLTIIMLDEQADPWAVKAIFTGDPLRIDSQFYIGYNMLLNLLRLEGADPEYMIQRSFSQFLKRRKTVSLSEEKKRIEKILSKYDIKKLNFQVFFKDKDKQNKSNMNEQYSNTNKLENNENKDISLSSPNLGSFIIKEKRIEGIDDLYNTSNDQNSLDISNIDELLLCYAQFLYEVGFHPTSKDEVLFDLSNLSKYHPVSSETPKLIIPLPNEIITNSLDFYKSIELLTRRIMNDEEVQKKLKDSKLIKNSDKVPSLNIDGDSCLYNCEIKSQDIYSIDSTDLTSKSHNTLDVTNQFQNQPNIENSSDELLIYVNNIDYIHQELDKRFSSNEKEYPYLQGLGDIISKMAYSLYSRLCIMLELNKKIRSFIISSSLSHRFLHPGRLVYIKFPVGSDLIREGTMQKSFNPSDYSSLYLHLFSEKKKESLRNTVDLGWGVVVSTPYLKTRQLNNIFILEPSNEYDEDETGYKDIECTTKESYKEKDLPSRATKQYVLKILINTKNLPQQLVSKILGNDKSGISTLNTEYNNIQSEDLDEYVIISCTTTVISEISTVRLNIPKNIDLTNNSKGTIRSLEYSLTKVKEHLGISKIPLLNYCGDEIINIKSVKNDNILKDLAKYRNIMNQIRNDSLLLKHDPSLTLCLLYWCCNKGYLESNILRLTNELSNHEYNILMQQELSSMRKVLRSLDYIDKNNVVQLKGRVACEISTSDELLITELLFNNTFFQELNIEYIVAILSCLLYDEKCQDMKLDDSILLTGFENLQQVGRMIVKVSQDSGLTITETEYLSKFKPQIMPIILKWCKGESFANALENTNFYEGSVIRCLRRLEELLRQVASACKSIGNENLENKLRHGIALIRRGIVFTASLYL